MIIVKCSECGSTELFIREQVTCRTPIGNWYRDDDGILQHDLLGGTVVDWNSQAPECAEAPYECKNCEHEFGADDLVVEETSNA